MTEGLPPMTEGTLYEGQDHLWKYANIIIEISHEKVDRPFQYRIPDALRGKIEAGMYVIVPFGAGNRELGGYVTELTDTPAYEVEKLKDILCISDQGVLVRGNQIRLASWMRERLKSD